MTAIVLINLTPHEVRIVSKKGETVKRFPSSGVARCEVRSEPGKTITPVGYGGRGGYPIPCVVETHGEVVGLPPMTEGQGFIVSSLVFEASDRVDLFAPSELYRDEAGRVVGCCALRTRVKSSFEEDDEASASAAGAYMMGKDEL